MYIHYTGYIITELLFPYGKFPYHLSSESSFNYEMLNPFYASIKEPFNTQRQCFNSLLMNFSDYYLPIKLSVPIRYLFLNNLRSTKYFNNINRYDYLLS